uniref:Solute carrier family 22 member 6 n=1 Tax=Sinocyclocheilus grahami TaxID=75366 RepID=A0A672LDQ3_SINGR
MAFSDLLEQVGSTGCFQFLHVTLLSMPILMMASHNLLQNFVAAVPPHHCAPYANLSMSSMGAGDVLQATVPLDQNGKPERCRRYVHPQLQLLSSNSSESLWEEGVEEIETQSCEDGWYYNTTEMSSTIISEVNGKFGGTCAAFSTSFTMFCIFRVCCGMALSGLVLNSFSLIVEWIPTRVRTVVGTGTGYFYTAGQLILAAVAYCIRDWRWLTLAVSLPFYVSFLYSWWFLESARWLVLTKKSEQAVKNLKTVARINGRRAEADKINFEMLQESMKKEMACSKGSYSALDLLRTSTMRTITVCLSAVGFSTSFAYYGLSMDLQKFGVSIYLIQIIFGAVDIPAKILVTISMSMLGQRPSQCRALVLAGVMILINLLVPYDLQVLRTSLAVTGKGCLAASFNCCYLYSGELYPTVIRQNGMGWVSMMARFGAMVAPMVLLLGEDSPWLPGFIYGGAPIVSGIFAFLLPETLAQPLPDTIQDRNSAFRNLLLLYIYIYIVGTESIQTPLHFSLFVKLQPFAKII